jgi:hypothetical protein
MRAPRYQFPGSVREATRDIAARMVRDGSVAHSPEELDAWIAGAPDVGATLTKGGYGTQFSSADLLPLLQVFIAKAGGPPPPSEVPPPAAKGRGLSTGVLAAAGILIVLVLVALAMGAFR